MEYFCPNCGAPLKFMSRVSVYTTCKFCNSTVVRHDMDLKSVGKVAELLQDMSPFQVGTSGVYEGRHFTLAGRIKVVYPKGMWSEWWALFDDGVEAWLAEAQGFLMMSFLVDDGAHWADVNSMDAVNAEVEIQGDRFKVDDVKTVRYAGSEGELPFVFQPNLKGTSVDLRAPGGKFASVFFSNEPTRVYVGKYLPFESFQFQNLRELDGWTIE